MPQLQPSPKGLDGFARYVDIPTGRPLFYRHEGNVEVFVRYLDGDTSMSPLTILDASAYAKLADAPNYGLNLGEIQHQHAPIQGNSEALAQIASGEAEVAAQVASGWPFKEPEVRVDGSSFLLPAAVLGLLVLLSAVVLAAGRYFRRG